MICTFARIPTGEPFFKRPRTIFELFSAFLLFPNYFAFVRLLGEYRSFPRPQSGLFQWDSVGFYETPWDSMRFHENEISQREAFLLTFQQLYGIVFKIKKVEERLGIRIPEDWKWSFDIPSIFHPCKASKPSLILPNLVKLINFWVILNFTCRDWRRVSEL